MTSSDATGEWVLAKLERARAHVDELEANIKGWLAANPYRLEPVIAEDRLSYQLILHLTSPPPVIAWAAIAGDCVHNLRSALDAAVWELAHENGGAPRNPKALQFPLTISHDDWSKQSARVLDGVPPVLLQGIERVQPYNHTAGGSQTSALTLLSQLDIEDKHRAGVRATINPTGASRRGQIQFESDEAAARHNPSRNPVILEMVDGAVLHEEQTKDPIVNVRGEFNATLIITLDTPRGPATLTKALRLMDRAVSNTLDTVYGYASAKDASSNGQH